MRIPAAACAVSLLWMMSCTRPVPAPAALPRVLFAHADADSARVVGAALVSGPTSREELYRRYPRREPDAWLAATLEEILADGGKTLHWSARPPETFECENGEVHFPIQVRTPPQCEERDCPVVVHFSGGCPRPGYHWRAEFFLRAGFIFAEPAIRGTSCSEDWARADDGPKRFEATTDIEATSQCLRARLTRHGVTPKLGALGWSYGGNQTLLAMTRFAGSYDAGFALAAKPDLLSFFTQAPAELRRQRTSEYGDPATQPELLRVNSPITYVDRVGGPVALMLGGRDPKVSLSDADAFVRALEARHQDASLMIVPKHAHLTERPEEVVFEHAHVLNFFANRFGLPLSVVTVGMARPKALPPPTQGEVERLPRVVRLLEKRGALPAQGPEEAALLPQAGVEAGGGSSWPCRLWDLDRHMGRFGNRCGDNGMLSASS
jgi:dipeptidyl aminopeptidase/acylaminoacyl peptidase